MLRVSVDNIRPGMILARPIPLPRDSRTFLLQRDVEIPMDLVPRLKQLNIREVWVRYRDLEFLEEVIDEELDEQQREIYSIVRRNFEAVMTGSAVELDVRQFQSSISNLFEFLKKSSCGNQLLQKLDAFDNFLVSHSTNVCYLSLLLGMKLERYLIEERQSKSPRDAKDLTQLGLGCLLHDIGKMRIPPEILNKPGKLTPEEMSIIKLHPEYGFEMLGGQAPQAAAQVVLNHHQRYDGKGYPARVDRRTGEPLPAAGGKTDSDLLPHRHDGRHLRRGDQQTLLFRGQAVGPGAARIANLVQRGLRPDHRRGLLPDHSAVPDRPDGDASRTGCKRWWSISTPAFRCGRRCKASARRTASGSPIRRWKRSTWRSIPELEITAVDGLDVRPFLGLQQRARLRGPRSWREPPRA